MPPSPAVIRLPRLAQRFTLLQSDDVPDVDAPLQLLLSAGLCPDCAEIPGTVASRMHAATQMLCLCMSSSPSFFPVVWPFYYLLPQHILDMHSVFIV
jgi:hypothetical protein